MKKKSNPMEESKLTVMIKKNFCENLIYIVNLCLQTKK